MLEKTFSLAKYKKGDSNQSLPNDVTEPYKFKGLRAAC